MRIKEGTLTREAKKIFTSFKIEQRENPMPKKRKEKSSPHNSLLSNLRAFSLQANYMNRLKRPKCN